MPLVTRPLSPPISHTPTATHGTLLLLFKATQRTRAGPGSDLWGAERELGGGSATELNDLGPHPCPLFSHLHSEGLGRIPPTLTSSRARVRAPGCQTDTPIRRQQSSRIRKAQPQTACLLPSPLPSLPRPQALSSDLTSLEAEGEENSLFGRSGGGAGRSNALQLQPASAASGVPPPHICPAPGCWRCSRPG